MDVQKETKAKPLKENPTDLLQVVSMDIVQACARWTMGYNC